MWLEIIVTSLITAFVSSGIVSAIFKKYFIDRLELRRRETELKIENKSKRLDKKIEEEITAYPELMSLCYRAKLLSDEWVTHNSLPSHKIEELREITGLITEALVRYRILVQNEIFLKIHQFKHLCQNFLVYADIATRTKWEDEEKSIRHTSQAQSKEIAEKLSKHIEMLDSDLRSVIYSITGHKT